MKRTLLILALLFSYVSILGAATKSLTYHSVLKEDYSRKVSVEWKIQNLKDSSLGYDDNLAKAAAVLSRSIYMEDDTLQKNLKALGFSDIVIQDENDVSHPLVAFAHQKHSGTNYYMVAIRGTASFSDFLTDLKAISDSFEEAADNTMGLFVQYLEGKLHKKNDKAKGEKNVFFITGHSLGGAVANILSQRMEEYAEKNNIFTYTFSSPNIGREYDSNALNIINSNDFVPDIPWPDGRNGQDIVFKPEELDESIYQELTGEELDAIIGFTIFNQWNNHILDTILTYVLSREQGLLKELQEKE